ncbi:MAG: hypothetical protein N4A49_12020 [Marinifilaceae bacterium]|jgi:tetratricopeptide (TPR) repeat protein|nr:hypothetical protein [Marinifilaceae bacterium]
MKDINDLIKLYSKEGERISNDELYKKVCANNSAQEKKLLGDAYLSDFGYCYYDFMCNKFKNLEDIWDLMESVEQIKVLIPDFEDYNEYKAKVYEILSSVSTDKEEQIKYLNLCIDHYKKQLAISENDNDILTDLAEQSFKLCEMTKQFDPTRFEEIKSFYLKALHIEQNEKDPNAFYGFNGSSIDSYLKFTYNLLTKESPEFEDIHHDFLSCFQSEIKDYAEEDKSIYYYWGNSLIEIVEGYEQTEQKEKENSAFITQAFINLMWEEILQLSKYLEYLEIKDEHFIKAIGRLFEKLGLRFENYTHLKIAYNYYKKAVEIENATWINVHYLSSILEKMSIYQLRGNNKIEAINLYKEALEVLKEAKMRLTDFQHSLKYGETLYNYAQFIENFENKETLNQAILCFEESCELGEKFYTQPYYGLAKTYLRLKMKDKALVALNECMDLFSNQYHIHNFRDIIDNEHFVEIREDLCKMIEAKQNRKA